MKAVERKEMNAKRRKGKIGQKGGRGGENKRRRVHAREREEAPKFACESQRCGAKYQITAKWKQMRQKCEK